MKSAGKGGGGLNPKTAKGTNFSEKTAKLKTFVSRFKGVKEPGF